MGRAKGGCEGVAQQTLSRGRRISELERSCGCGRGGAKPLMGALALPPETRRAPRTHHVRAAAPARQRPRGQ
jgi:hypothetical protein